MKQRSNLALRLPQKQKLLGYWRRLLLKAYPGGETNQSVADLLRTYELLLSKAAKASEESALEETENRLSSLERQLGTLFDSRRLMTSPIGAPSVEHLHTSWDR